MAERNDPDGTFRASDAAWSRLAVIDVALASYAGDHAGRGDLVLEAAEIVRVHGLPPA